MHDLLARAIAAHGGLDRWNTFKGVTATIVTGGGVWPMKGLEQDSNPREMTVTLHEETTSVSPFCYASTSMLLVLFKKGTYRVLSEPGRTQKS